ncbi:MAG: DUF481 domain-containing protein [Deltaproteobacteria bacterium]|nr:DUF481 domain-containing protein [Deltaproteobacteria bacterium]
MMKRIPRNDVCVIFTLILAVAMTPMVWAEEKAWEDSAELSYVQTSGNTDILTLAGKNSLKYRFSDQWTSMWNIGALYGKTDGDKDSERYYTDLRTDYKATERIYYYGLAGWFQDKFSGIDSRYYLGPGVGYWFLKGERHYLSAEAGLNYAREDYTDSSDNDFLEGRLWGKCEYVFNSKTRFSQTAEYLQNFDNADKYRINALTALTTMLTDRFSLKVSYEINYKNEPIPDILERTDTIFSVALVVNL